MLRRYSAYPLVILGGITRNTGLNPCYLGSKGETNTENTENIMSLDDLIPVFSILDNQAR